MRFSIDMLALPCINASLSFAYTMEVPWTFLLWLRHVEQSVPRTHERAVDNTKLDRRTVMSTFQAFGRAQCVGFPNQKPSTPLMLSAPVFWVTGSDDE
jgi:hypothetical protein